ncbi:MAG: methionyl-tRNA formyltransferase [Flavobacteriales bacterium]|nr:methionyl-tRNA formyltransferase [Flavobacteriales bacterium]
MELPRIVFLGTPEFAVASLNALFAHGVPIAAVVTAPDRPAGRGRKLRMSAVKERAIELGVPVYQPMDLKDPDFLRELDRCGASLYVVVAFRMLPEQVWARPVMGTFNLHASLLPDYRGAAPINWAIMNGEQRTGVTTFKLQRTIDTGDILLQEEVHIGPDETAGELHDRLMIVGAHLLVRTVEGAARSDLRPVPQDQITHGALHPAPKLTSLNCRIDVQRPARQVHDLVRGLSPAPGAWTTLVDDTGREGMFKVLRTQIRDLNGTPGTIADIGGRPVLHCGNGSVELIEVLPEGRRRMTGKEFLQGQRRSFRLV